MSDRSERKPTSSEEMIRQAKQGLDDAVHDSAIDEIVADLENIGTKSSPADRYPDSGTPPAKRVESTERPRRVASAYDDPFDRDSKAKVVKRPGVAIAAAVFLILIGAFIAFISASVGS